MLAANNHDGFFLFGNCAIYHTPKDVYTQSALCCVLLWVDSGRFHPHPSGIFLLQLGQSDMVSPESGLQNVSKPVSCKNWWYNHNKQNSAQHDDVIKWKHFPRYWLFVWGIHRSPMNSPHKGLWRGALMFSLICAWVNNREAGDWRRHRVHYDFIVMGNPVQILLHIVEAQICFLNQCRGV